MSGALAIRPSPTTRPRATTAPRRTSSGVLRLRAVEGGRMPNTVRSGERTEAVRILVVEDNPLDVELLTEYLSRDHVAYQLTSAPRLGAAEEELRRAAFDVVLLDLRLPDGEKLDALGRLLAACPDAPVVVLTGLDDEELAHRCLAAGADDYIEKSHLSPQVLRRALGHALARSRSRQLRRDLEHADRLATLGKLAAGIAHEINNPAAVVHVNLQTTLERLEALRGCEGVPDDVIEELLAMTADNAEGVERITTIVRELGAFSRIEPGQVTWVDVADVCRRTCSMLANEVRHRARFILDLESVPRVAVDAGKIAQVLVNLVINAIQAITPGSSAGHEIRVGTADRGDHLAITVSDTGKGIPPRDLERIFEPFFTTKPRGEGTGLGLSIAADIVAQFGGEIRVESEEARGTRFEVLLPCDTGLVVSPPAPAAPESAGERRARVLVIDDEVALTAALRRSLSKHHDVVVASGGAAALALLEHDVAFDAVLCDLMMPGVDGCDVHAALIDRAPVLARKFAVLSGGAFTSRAVDFIEASGVTVVPKPAPVPRLLALVDELARRK